jgi:hypothetical protein
VLAVVVLAQEGLVESRGRLLAAFVRSLVAQEELLAKQRAGLAVLGVERDRAAQQGDGLGIGFGDLDLDRPHP